MVAQFNILGLTLSTPGLVDIINEAVQMISRLFLDAIASVGLPMSVSHTFLSVMEFLLVNIQHEELDYQ